METETVNVLRKKILGHKGVVFCSKNALKLTYAICEFKFFSGVITWTLVKGEGIGTGRKGNGRLGQGRRVGYRGGKGWER